jgi:molecular chaperone IbpA
LYKGIANRAFSRTFNLADTIEVKDASLVNGMLKVFLENIIPENQKPRKMDIKEEPSNETASGNY